MISHSYTFTDPGTGARAEVGVITHGGREFSRLGAVIEADRIACYLGPPDGGVERVGASGDATDWQGKPLGRYAITARWRTPDRYLSSHMVQAVVTLPDGRRFTGRGGGAGLLWRGKRMARSR